MNVLYKVSMKDCKPISKIYTNDHGFKDFEHAKKTFINRFAENKKLRTGKNYIAYKEFMDNIYRFVIAYEVNK